MSNTKRSTTGSKATQQGTPTTGSVDDLTQRNVELIRTLEETAKRERTRSDLVAEAIANFCGSMTFVWVHVVWFGGWILINLVPGFHTSIPFLLLF
jgi:uncharacterized membrane protein